VTRERLLAILGTTILRLLLATVRFRAEDPSEFAENSVKRPVIICFWHNRILGITLAFLRGYPHRVRKGVNVLTSASRDGEILAQVMGQLGMEAVRGSSSRRGSRAMRELIDLIEDGYDVAITPDGPRGPRYSFGPGAISLAQLTGSPLTLMHAKFSRCFRMKTWDGFIIPLPFSEVAVKVEPPIYVPRKLDEKEFEATRSRMEMLLRNEAD
jgi:lysophospholipid acyltransferase (LPLAT)-like uncharacterized protein